MFLILNFCFGRESLIIITSECVFCGQNDGSKMAKLLALVSRTVN